MGRWIAVVLISGFASFVVASTHSQGKVVTDSWRSPSLLDNSNTRKPEDGVTHAWRHCDVHMPCHGRSCLPSKREKRYMVKGLRAWGLALGGHGQPEKERQSAELVTRGTDTQMTKC